MFFSFSLDFLRFRAFQCFFFFSFCQVKNTRENFSFDFLITNGKVGVWFIIYLMQNVFKFIYFILLQDNFIFGDVISTYMWEMSLAFKNGCVYFLDHWSDMATLENQKSYNNIQTIRVPFS